MAFAKLEGQGDLEVIRYAHTAAVTAWTPIFVALIGVLIPIVTAAINVETTYYRCGVYKCDITGGVTITQFQKVYYITATDKVTNVDPGAAAGFLLGFAISAGTATAGYVDVCIYEHPMSSQITARMLATGLRPSYITVYEGTFEAGGTQTTETKVISGVLSTDEAWMEVKTLGGDVTSYIRSVTAADGSISCILNTPMGTGSPVIKYRVDRAVS
jgi:hypothetical protein